MVSNASRALTTFLFNIQLMRLVGEAGVSAITIMQYVNFVFIAVMIGFSVGSAPVIGYHYGAQNHAELKGLFRICMTFIIAACLLMFVLSELVAGPLVTVFADSQSLYEMTLRGFRLFAVSFAVVGVNIFASAFFTALCNGAVSAFISFVRTIVFEAGAVMLLPIVLGLNGVWLALPVAEGLALLVSVLCFVISGSGINMPDPKEKAPAAKRYLFAAGALYAARSGRAEESGPEMLLRSKIYAGNSRLPDFGQAAVFSLQCQPKPWCRCVGHRSARWCGSLWQCGPDGR